MLSAPDHAELVRFVTRYVGPQDAEDVVQTAYLKVLTTQAPFREASTFKTWVFAVAKRAALDQLRGADEALALEGRRIEGLAPSSLAFDVERIVASLPSVEADAWRAYETHGEGPAAALVCGISLRTFRRRYYAAQAKIREALQ